MDQGRDQVWGVVRVAKVRMVIRTQVYSEIIAVFLMLADSLVLTALMVDLTAVITVTVAGHLRLYLKRNLRGGLMIVHGLLRNKFRMNGDEDCSLYLMLMRSIQ